MLDELRRIALFTSGVAELSRHRAEQLVKSMVKTGDIRGAQAPAWVRNLMETSKQNRLELVAFIRSEMQGQVANLGLATKRDLERMERRVARLETSLKAERAKTTARKTTVKKTSTKSTTGKPGGGGSAG
jgi:polyhydroxyalkanoate synthesis regulator phasin